jgi:acetoin utilization protein AcuB
VARKVKGGTEEMYVKEYMHTDVITVTKDTLLGDAQKIMSEHNIHRLPVVEEHKLIGLVTQDRIRETTKHPGLHVDTLQFLRCLSIMRVEDVMVTDVITVTPDMTVEEAMVIGQKHRVGTLPVVENGKLVGIVTTTDLYKLAAQILGFGTPGVRLHVFGTKARPIGEVTGIIASRRVEILSLVRITPPGTGRYDSIIHLNTDDASNIVTELMRRGYGVDVRPPVSEAQSEVLVGA